MGLVKKILFPLLLILAVVGGAVGGDFLKRGSSDSAVIKPSEADTEGAKAKGEQSAEGKGGSDDAEYLKFKRQFVTPVVTGGRVDSLVIMNLNIEIESSKSDKLYTKSPRFRDAITRELLSLSGEGVFGEQITSPEAYETIRIALLDAVKAVTEDGVKDILILDLARQDQ